MEDENDIGNGAYFVGFSLILNDLKGGSATATIYENVDGTYVATSEKAIYDGEDTDVWEFYDMLYQLDRGSATGAKGNIKIVFDCTYPDNCTESIESDEEFVHSGTFITSDGVTYGGPADSPILTFSFTLDDTLVELTEIDIGDAYYDIYLITDEENDVWEYISLPTPSITRDGTSVSVVYQLTQPLEPGKYIHFFYLYYKDWEGNASDTFNVS